MGETTKAPRPAWHRDPDLLAGVEALLARRARTEAIREWLAARGHRIAAASLCRDLCELGLTARYPRKRLPARATPPAEQPDPVRVGQAAARAAEQQAETRRLLREAVARQDLIDAFARAMAETPRIEVVPPRADTRPHRPRTLLLCLSDVHVGQLFHRHEAGGLGEYNLDLFEERMHRISSKVLAIARDLRMAGPINRLVVNFGGDLLDGTGIYAAQHAETEGLGVQLRVGPDVMAQTLMRDFAAGFTEVDVFSHPGNHGKPGGRKSPADYVRDSLDGVFVDIMRVHCAKLDNVTWHRSDTWFNLYTIFDHWFFSAHGDAFKSWCRIPFYGAQRYLQDISSMLHRQIDALIVGHHHTPASFPHAWANIVMNGSVPGNSKLGTQLGLSGPPVQKLLLVSQDYPVATQYDLHLASRAEVLTYRPVHLDPIGDAGRPLAAVAD